MLISLIHSGTLKHKINYHYIHCSNAKDAKVNICEFIAKCSHELLIVLTTKQPYSQTHEILHLARKTK